MRYETALKHFGTGLEIARLLEMKSQSVYLWKKTGIVPKKRAERLQQLSNGKCKVDPSVYRKASSQGKTLGRAALPG